MRADQTRIKCETYSLWRPLEFANFVRLLRIFSGAPNKVRPTDNLLPTNLTAIIIQGL